MNKDLLISYHKLYGFTVLKDLFPNLIVFGQSFGYFTLATIVSFNPQTDVEEVVREYEEIGYNCNKKTYQTEEEAHMDLYEHFFKVELSKQRAQNEYSSYCTRQSEKLGSKYRYVDSPFLIDDFQDKHGLVDLLCSTVLNTDEPVLCIIEAAAGYGKTCAAYELYRKLSSIEKIAPLFIELSKNRSAKLFRYVLLDEIDRKYSHIKADTVQNEIEAGLVPLIIDGFDELLSKAVNQIDSVSSFDDDFEQAETMLDTIVALLKGKARIFLTSRKSSIFCGSKYEDWLQQHLNQFQVKRVSLNEPNIRDWLGDDKITVLNRHSVPLSEICNPVILSYLRNTDVKTLDSDEVTSDSIIRKYFDMLLKRETERQDLPMDVSEQYELFKKLAGEMVGFDITSEQKDFIADLIKEIYDLEVIRQRAVGNKPSIDELAFKLAGHVLLDRVFPTRDSIGFINDFVFGILIGDYLISAGNSLVTISPRFVDFAVTAYSVQSSDKRKELYSALCRFIGGSIYYSLIMDIKLLHTLSKNYEQMQLSTQEFGPPFLFDSQFKFIECVFNQCNFSHIAIVPECFEKCTFINCEFLECNFIMAKNASIDNAFYGCKGHERFLEACVYSESDSEDGEVNFEKKVLEQFWPIGKNYTQDRCTYRTLLAGFSPKDSNNINEAINSLKRKSIITRRGQYYYLETKTKLTEIREILGRTQRQ